MRQHSITFSLGLIAVALSSCAQDAPPPPAPTPTPASPSFDKPLVQEGKKENKAEKPNDNNLPVKPPETQTNTTPGLLPPTNPDDRVGAKGRRDPFAIITLQPTDVETPGGLKITIKPNQFLQSRFRTIQQLPIFPQLPNLNKSQNRPNLPARSIQQLPTFPQLPNLNKTQNGSTVPARSIPQLPIFPQLPNLNPSEKAPDDQVRSLPQLPRLSQLTNLKPSAVKKSSILKPDTLKIASGIKNANNILFVANKPKTATGSKDGTNNILFLANKPKTTGTTTTITKPKPKTTGTTTTTTITKPKTAGTTTTKPKPKTAGTTTTTTITKPKTSGSNEVTTKKPSTPSIAKPEQPLVLPPNQEIPVFKPELPPIPEPTIALGVQVTGVIEIANIPYAFVKSPDEPSARTVKIGDRLSSGQVLVKRIEVNQKTVVLEQNGIEVNQRLIEGTPKKQV